MTYFTKEKLAELDSQTEPEMKVSDLHRKYAAALDLCEKHGVNKLYAIRFDGKFLSFLPNFDLSIDKYSFPVAVVERKPVFVGDKLFAPCGSEITIDEYLFELVKENVLVEKLSWQPPKQKTFMLNGVEFVCPTRKKTESNPYVQVILNDFFILKMKKMVMLLEKPL